MTKKEFLKLYEGKAVWCKTYEYENKWEKEIEKGLVEEV